MSNEPLWRQVLDAPMDESGNDANAETVGEYLHILLETLWTQEHQFSGKRPFGNSSWKFEIYEALIQAGLIRGSFDDQGFVEDVDDEQADQLILDAIAEVFRARD